MSEPLSVFPRIARAAKVIGRQLSQHPWVLLPFLGLPLAYPFLTRGMPGSADGALHLMRLGLLDHYLRHGILFPRWSPDLVLGLGYPVFSYYAPGAYYLAELLHLTGFGFPGAVMGTIFLLLLAAGAGMYCLARDILGREQRWATLVAAVAYMYAPYLLLNAFVRGAIAEVAAQALLPWLLWSVRRLIIENEPGKFFLPVVACTSGLILAHNITLLLAPPFIVGYAVVLVWRRPKRVPWLIGAGLLALVCSAFFWAPLVAERRYLAEGAYKVSLFTLRENPWNWRNFWDPSLQYRYVFDIPYRLGLIQLFLALLGLILARRKDAEWLFLFGATLAYALFMGEWSLPIWEGSQLLQIAQFQWRLLSVVSIPLSLWIAGNLLPMPIGRWQVLGAAGLIALTIYAQYPRIEWMKPGQAEQMLGLLPAIAQFEKETGAYGTTNSHEFVPRWAGGYPYLESPEDRVPPLMLAAHRGGPLSLDLGIEGAAGGPLRFATLYFPGWRARLDGATELPVYPSTNLGLLTVDLPPGRHELSVTWQGTSLQQVAALISEAGLLVLAAFCLAQRQRRLWASAPLVAFLIGVLGLFLPERTVAISVPQQPLESGGLRLLGYRLESHAPGYLLVFPYWHVGERQPGDLRFRWQLRDVSGNAVTELIDKPYFNTTDASQWPPGTVVDDADQIPLPPGLSAGTYAVTVQIESPLQGRDLPTAEIAQVTIERPIANSPPIAHPLDLRFGGVFQLIGYDVAPVTLGTSSTQLPVVSAGQALRYTLDWELLDAPVINYHSFLHLVDTEGKPLVQADQIPGSIYYPPLLWALRQAQADHYQLSIPETAAERAVLAVRWVIRLQDWAAPACDDCSRTSCR